MLAAFAPCVARHLGVVAVACHRVVRGIDGAEHIEIEKAVIDRRHQRIRHRMRQPHQESIAARRIDDDEVMRAFDRGHCLRKLIELERFVLRDLHTVAELQAIMLGHFEHQARLLRPGTAIIDITGKAALAAIEIDGGDALAGLEQGHCDMQRGRGLARPALLVAEHDDMRRAGLLCALHQHRLRSRRIARDPSIIFKARSFDGQEKCEPRADEDPIRRS